MRTSSDTYVSGEHDEVHVRTWIYGSFEVHYAEHIDKVIVQVRCDGGWAVMSMQLTTDQATILRDLVDAGITEAEAAKAVPAEEELTPSGHRQGGYEGVAPAVPSESEGGA